MDGQRRVAKEPLVFVLAEIRDFLLVPGLSNPPFTAVAGNKLTSAGKTVDGQAAVVGTALAFGHGSGEFQPLDLFDGQHGSLRAFLVAFSRNESRPESAHNAGNVGPNHLAACNFFKASKNGIVVEGAALDYDMPA
ncbi:hypothetical protein IMSAGC007_04835 [Lachnospiraceae bacterium]|nr:hypothetical protein IMSAGC007_04835 [Lachnospiraceae bacterium]